MAHHSSKNARKFILCSHHRWRFDPYGSSSDMMTVYWRAIRLKTSPVVRAWNKHFWSCGVPTKPNIAILIDTSTKSHHRILFLQFIWTVLWFFWDPQPTRPFNQPTACEEDDANGLRTFRLWNVQSRPEGKVSAQSNGLLGGEMTQMCLSVISNRTGKMPWWQFSKVTVFERRSFL